MTITQAQTDSDQAIQSQLLALRPGQAVECGGVTAASVLMGWDVAGVVFTSAGEAAQEVLRLRDTGAVGREEPACSGGLRVIGAGAL